MKRAIIALLCFGMVISASAQSGVNTVDQKHLNKFYVSYSPLSKIMKSKGEKTLETGFNAFEFGYMHGIAVAKVPLYVEFGAAFDYCHYRNDMENRDSTMKTYSVNIPVNIAYRLSFRGGKMHLTPYTGLYGRINVAGKAKNEYIDWERRVEVSRETALFGEDGYLKKFQLGWQVGVAFDINKFYLQLGYLTDITSVEWGSGSVRMGGFNFGLGVIF